MENNTFKGELPEDDKGIIEESIDFVDKKYEQMVSFLQEEGILDTEQEKVQENLSNSDNLSYDTARLLIQKGFGMEVMSNLSSFSLSEGESEWLIQTLPGFFDEKTSNSFFPDKLKALVANSSGLDHQTAYDLISNGFTHIVLDNFSSFEKTAIYSIFGNLDEEGFQYLKQIMGKLDLTEYNKIFLLNSMFNKGNSSIIYNYGKGLDDFSGMQEDVVDISIERGDIANIIFYMEDFNELDIDFFLERAELLGVSKEYILNVFNKKF